MPTVMFQCKDCLSIIRSREAYASHVWKGRDIRCPRCPITFKNICGYQAHKFSEHISPNKRMPFEVAHKASSSSSSLSYTSAAEESPQKPSSIDHQCQQQHYQPDGTDNQWPRMTSGLMGTMSSNFAPSFGLTNGLPACLPQPLYRFGEPGIPSATGALNQPTPNNPPVGELLDLGPEPAEDEMEKLEGAIQALHSLVAGKRFEQEQPEIEEEHINNLALENVLRNAEAPKPVAPETPQGQNCATEDTSKDPVDEIQVASDAPKAIMGAIVCFECEAIFSTLLGLQHHQIMAKHNYCHLCNAFFVDRSLLKEHKNIVHGFKCAGCALEFDSWEGLMTHQRTGGHCYCKACHCYFSDSDSHDRHVANHHPVNAIPNYDEQFPSMQQQRDRPCLHCDKVLPDQPGLDQHIKQAHTYDCSSTNCKFSGITAAHLKTHQQLTGHDYCAPCGRAFVDHLGFISHQKSEKHLKKLKEQNGA